MVLAIAALLFALGLQRYAYYHRQIEMERMQQDLNQIRNAANAYYHQLTCDQRGYLDADANRHPLLSELGIQLRHYERYSLSIIQLASKDAKAMPLYAIRLRETFLENYSAGRMQWLAKRFVADSYSDTTLTWQWLPIDAPALNRESTRRSENKKIIEDRSLRAASYCAH